MVTANEGTSSQQVGTTDFIPSLPASIRTGHPNRMEPTSNKTLAIVFIIGSIVAIAGIVVGSLWTSIYATVIANELTLTQTSTEYNMWKETPIPMYLKLYLFNWTNAEDFGVRNYIKPHFVEMGPYVFRQVDYKVNMEWNDNGTITYQRRRIWHFDESMSNGNLNDSITNLNAVAATVAYMVRHQVDIVRDVADRFMRSIGERIVTTKTVKELLFDGYNDTMLRVGEKLHLSMPFSKFGWFYGRNGSDTYDGTFNMNTGKDDIYGMGMLREWNYSNETAYYHGSCGRIKGSNGDLWPPLPNNHTAPVFISDICTYLNLTYENTTEFQGLSGVKFVSDEDMLENGTMVRSRRCYCYNSDCQPSGMMNISMCKYGAPAFVSMPHFYLADPTYRLAVSGMNPRKELHETILVVEPTTGLPMQVKAQLQINLLVQPDPKMKLFKNIKKTYIPMLWFTQEANLTSNYASMVKVLLILPSLGVVTCFGVAAIGILLIIIGFFLCIRRKWQGEEGQVLLNKNEVNSVTNPDGS